MPASGFGDGRDDLAPDEDSSDGLVLGGVSDATDKRGLSALLLQRIQMFLTGVNPGSPPIPTGQVAPLTPLSHAQGSLSATIGSRVATVQFAGAAPLMVIDQVNLQIPIDLPPGD